MSTDNTNQEEKSATDPQPVIVNYNVDDYIKYYENSNNIITISVLVCIITFVISSFITYICIGFNNCYKCKWILLVLFLTLTISICCILIVYRFYLKMKKEHQSLMNKQLDIINNIENKKFDLRFYKFYIDKKKKEQENEIEYKNKLFYLEINKCFIEQQHEIKLKLMDALQTIINNNNIANNINIEKFIKKETINDNNKIITTKYVEIEKINDFIDKYLSHNKEQMEFIKELYELYHNCPLKKLTIDN